MLRFDNATCGTSTTGTGTLTFAACPSPPGGIDLYQWLVATGVGFVNGNALIVSYTIIEYTSATFGTAQQTEKGVGILTLGASLTASTLARTKVQTIATGMNTSTPAPTVSAPTAITIGTAANTLVFIGASAADTLALQPFNDTATTTNGFPPLMTGASQTSGGAFVQNNQDWTWPFIWPYQMLVKRVYFRTESRYTGGTSNLYARLYQINSSGQPGKLLCDFGVIGTLNSSFDVADFTMLSSAALTNGFLLTPGEYFITIFTTYTGGAGTPQLTQWNYGGGPITSGFRGSAGVGPFVVTYDNSGNATAPDPAPAQLGAVSGLSPCFFLAAS